MTPYTDTVGNFNLRQHCDADALISKMMSPTPEAVEPSSSIRYFPSPELLEEMMTMLRALLFPSYYGTKTEGILNSPYAVGSALEKAAGILYNQLSQGLGYSCQFEKPTPLCREESCSVVERFLKTLPGLKRMLELDVKACYDGDPAARSYGEIIYAYPSIRSLLHFRVAHELHKMKVPVIPRILTEIAHAKTGIDIHPGATIGESFFMDHGTGIVIGETTVIGRNVRIYQGVTLGAKRFSRNRDGTLVKGEARHPIVEDNVTIYSGATVLGRIRIGTGAIIGGNLWITSDVPSGSKLVQNSPKEIGFLGGEGI